MKGVSPSWQRHRGAKIEVSKFNLMTEGEVVDKATTMGIDLAKGVFPLRYGRPYRRASDGSATYSMQSLPDHVMYSMP